MTRGLILIDGSYLFSAIAELKRKKPTLSDKKLDIKVFTNYLNEMWTPYIGSLIRINFYFRTGDPRIENLLYTQNLKVPKAKNHWRFIECGQKVDALPESEVLKLGEQFRDSYPRAEKGLDTKLVCDALTLAATNRASDFVFFINDRDYIPLFEAINAFGGCNYLSAFTSTSPQEKILSFMDLFIEVSIEIPDLFCK